MTPSPSKRILVIAGSRRSGAFIRFLDSSPDYNVTGVYAEKGGEDIFSEARLQEIPIIDDWREFLKTRECDAVLDLSGSGSMSDKIKMEAAPLGIEVMGEMTANLIWSLLRASWARDVFDRLLSKIEPSWSFDEILILVLESARKLTSSSSGIIFLGKKGALTDKISWGIGGAECEEALSQVKDFARPEKDFYKNHARSLYIPLFDSGSLMGGLALFDVKSDNIDDGITELIQNKITGIIIQTKALHKTIKLSNVDGLTGLFNHRFFHERMEKEIYRAQQYDLNFSLMILDIDDFKKFNDTHGHLAGDKHLKTMAKILHFILRETDFVARYGGEEFAVILPEAPIGGALIAAERIRKAVENQNFAGSLRSTVSIGLAAYPDHGVKKNDIIDKADKALYEAKAAGKNRVRVFGT
ncbi:GGDEF domain-containing protein [bacterium]|nr:GGDEF domain-containing protein [bacterium]MBU3956136.1 GGDEF domain-containing protein [bacterium]MBU4134014.1 GGDEF domain-containing protein [bacterium]